ncbi:MAG: hypothetical protein JOZ61_11380 [Verrucomicrobia bacterium]|nr:hypothetical protein [Verrucomicrobiota bacterium]
MTFLKDSKFFFTLYHAGKVNIILHVVSFSFLFSGLTVKSVPLVLIGLFIFDEMGHAYNYFLVHNRDPRFGLRMIPYQLLYASGDYVRPAQTLWLVLNSEQITKSTDDPGSTLSPLASITKVPSAFDSIQMITTAVETQIRRARSARLH